MLTVHEQDRLSALHEKIEVVFIYRCPDADQSLHAIVIDSNFQAHARAKRKSAQGNFICRIFFSEVIQTRADVVALAVTFVMRAGALSDATKIDAKRNQSRIIQGRGCAKNYFVVHRPAAERMRMPNQGDTACGLKAWCLQNRFQLSVRRRNE